MKIKPALVTKISDSTIWYCLKYGYRNNYGQSPIAAFQPVALALAKYRVFLYPKEHPGKLNEN